MKEVLSIETAVIINRVSSEEQSEGYSLESQEEGNREYARRQGFRVLKSFSLAESARGVKSRKEFQSAIFFAIENKVQHIIIEKTDRLARNLVDMAWVDQIIKKHPVTFHFRKENMTLNAGSSSHDRLNVGFKSLLAQYYSDNSGEEIKKGVKRKIESGLPHTRIFGYRWIDKMLVPHETQADQYRLMVDLYFKHQSVVEVADQMNMRGIIAPRGGRWNHQTVNQVLTHPMHSGYFRFKEKIHKGKYEALISEEKWHTMQTMIAANTSPKTQRQWLLSGLLRHVNGRSFSGEKQKGLVYYGARRENGRSRLYVRQDYVLNEICEILQKVRWSQHFADQVVEIARIVFRRENSTNDAEISELRSRFDSAVMKERRLVELYMENNIDKMIYSEKRALLAEEKAVLENAMSRTHRDEQKFIAQIEHMAESLKTFPVLFAQANDDERAEILNTLCEYIAIDEDKNVKVVYRKPFAMFMKPEILAACGSNADQFDNLVLLETSGIEPPTSTMPL